MRVQKFFKYSSKVVVLALTGLVVLITASFLVWKVGQDYVSPSIDFKDFGGTKIAFKVSDRSSTDTPLENKLTGTDAANYTDYSVAVPVNRDQMLRIQGQVLFRHVSNNNRATEGVLTISLPASAIYTPDRLKFGTSEYVFTNNCFKLNGVGECSQKVTAELIDGNDNSIAKKRYKVTVKFPFPEDNNNRVLGAINDGVERFIANSSAYAYSPPPATNMLLMRVPRWDWRMTFKKQVTENTVAQIVGQVRDSVGIPQLEINKCTGNNTNYLCTIIESSLVVDGRAEFDSLKMRQAYSLSFPGVITVDGNVGSQQGSTSRITLADGSILYGNSSNIGGTPVAGGDVPFDWEARKTEVEILVREAKAQRTISNATTVGSRWNLNSIDNIPDTDNKSTFSTPPEGQLWKVNGNLTLEGTLFSGSGTLIVSGNVDAENITCSSGTRLGIIATGKITFSGNSGTPCGAYFAYGNIEVQMTNGTMNTILIAGNNITFDNIPIGSNLNVKYDAVFGADPTVLFRDLLKIIYKTTS